MSKLQTRNDVAGCVNARDAGLQALVGDYVAAVDGYTLLLEPESGAVRAAANSNQQQLSVELSAVFEANNYTVVVLSYTREANTGLEVDAALAEGSLKRLGDGWVLIWNEVWETFDYGHIGSERLPDRGELDTDNSTAEDDHLVRHEVELKGVLRSDYSAANLQTRERTAVRASREHDVSSGVVVAVHGNGLRTGEATLAANYSDALGRAH